MNIILSLIFFALFHLDDLGERNEPYADKLGFKSWN